jgi:hypothetical protein
MGRQNEKMEGYFTARARARNANAATDGDGASDWKVNFKCLVRCSLYHGRHRQTTLMRRRNRTSTTSYVHMGPMPRVACSMQRQASRPIRCVIMVPVRPSPAIRPSAAMMPAIDRGTMKIRPRLRPHTCCSECSFRRSSSANCSQTMVVYSPTQADDQREDPTSDSHSSWH